MVMCGFRAQLLVHTWLVRAPDVHSAPCLRLQCVTLGMCSSSNMMRWSVLLPKLVRSMLSVRQTTPGRVPLPFNLLPVRSEPEATRTTLSVEALGHSRRDR